MTRTVKLVPYGIRPTPMGQFFKEAQAAGLDFMELADVAKLEEMVGQSIYGKYRFVFVEVRTDEADQLARTRYLPFSDVESLRFVLDRTSAYDAFSANVHVAQGAPFFDFTSDLRALYDSHVEREAAAEVPPVVTP